MPFQSVRKAFISSSKLMQASITSHAFTTIILALDPHPFLPVLCLDYRKSLIIGVYAFVLKTYRPTISLLSTQTLEKQISVTSLCLKSALAFHFTWSRRQTIQWPAKLYMSWFFILFSLVTHSTVVELTPLLFLKLKVILWPKNPFYSNPIFLDDSFPRYLFSSLTLLFQFFLKSSL